MRKEESNHLWVYSSCDLPYWSLDPPFCQVGWTLQSSCQTGSLLVGLGLGMYPCPVGHPGSPDLCLCDSSLPWWGLRLRAEKRERVVRVNLLYVCSLSCSTTVWGRGFPCQPYRDSEAPVVSGPLIGQHSPADLIPYAPGPGRGSGCIRKCYFTQPIFGCVRKYVEVSS